MKNLMKFLPLFNKLSSKTNPDTITICIKNPKTGAYANYSIDADMPILQQKKGGSSGAKTKMPDSLSIRDLLKMANEGTIELKDILAK